MTERVPTLIHPTFHRPLRFAIQRRRRLAGRPAPVPIPSGVSLRNDQFGLPILSIHGELDFYASGSLLKELEKVVDEGHARIALDLSEVTRIDPSGGWVLLTAQQFLARSKRRLLLLDPPPAVHQALQNCAAQLAP